MFKMNKNIKEVIIAALAISALSASAKAFLDVEVLKTEQINLKEAFESSKKDNREILLEMKDDIKFLIRKHTK